MHHKELHFLEIQIRDTVKYHVTPFGVASI